MKHRFCKVTGYCERCGLPKDQVNKHPISLGHCWPARNIVSIAWWRKLQAHHQLKTQLEKSVESALKEK